MNAIQLLKSDHRRVEELFREYERTNGRKTNKRGIVQRIIKELSAHTEAEERIFYPAVVAGAPEVRRLVLKAIEEHHVMKLELAELERMNADDERWEAKVLFLMDAVRMHVVEEEGVLFPTVRDAIPKRAFDRLGQEIERAKRRVPREISTELPILPRQTRRADGAAVLERAQRAIQETLRARKVRAQRGAAAWR
jgi:hemerythrin superfamily protein